MHKPPPLLTRTAAPGSSPGRKRCWLGWQRPFRRYPLLDSIEPLARGLAICRIIERAHLQERPRVRLLHDTIGAGFRRRIERSEILRGIAGSRWREALKHSDLAQRLQRLLAALADINAFARRHLLRHAMRRQHHLVPLGAAPSAQPPAQRATSGRWRCALA